MTSSDGEDDRHDDEDDRLERWRQQSTFDVEHWYELLRGHTAETAIVPLPADVARALVASYRHRFLRRDEPTEAQLTALREYTARLQQDCAAMESEGFFVRLGSRSPKDAEAAVATREAYDAELQRRTVEDGAEDGYGTADDSCNAQLRAYFEVAHQALRVRSAEAAVALLCSSERVCRDVERSLASGVAMSVCLRAWQPALRQEYEFRGFVCGGKLTHVSQYNPYVHTPQVVASRDDTLATLERFWREEIDPRLRARYGSYIVDFALLSTGDVVVVELNPFDEQTGGGLFRWEDPDDRALMERGPLGLRMATRPRQHMQATIEVFVAELRT